MVPLLFSPEDVASMICAGNNLTTEQISTLPQSIPNELWPIEKGAVAGSCSHMTSSLHYRALTCIFGWHCESCSKTMISESAQCQQAMFYHQL